MKKSPKKDSGKNKGKKTGSKIFKNESSKFRNYQRRCNKCKELYYTPSKRSKVCLNCSQNDYWKNRKIKSGEQNV